MQKATWDAIVRALAVRPPVPVADETLPRAAVALALRDAAPGIEVLFIRRAESKGDPWSGQMAFPGGRSELEDADLRATAIRETLEETGVDLAQSAEFLGALDEVRAMARMRPMNLAIAPFVFRLREAVTARPLSEVRSVHWLPLDELLGPGRRSSFEYVLDGSTLQFPCLRFDDVVIWGLTLRMFSNFEALLSGTSTDAAASVVPQ